MLAYTHSYRAKSVNRWATRNDVAQIFAEGDDDPVLYDHYNKQLRSPITREQLTELPLLDENDDLIRIFDQDGWEVSRRDAVHLPTTEAFAGLVDLTRVHKLFAPADEEEDWEAEGNTKFQVYPQAGLVTAGHVVGQGLMYSYHNVVRALNESLRQPTDEDDENMGDAQWNQASAVIGIACQMYNAVMHQTRGNSAQQHGVVLGNVTAALAGHFAQNPKNKAKANSFVRKCDVHLPHEEYVHKITGRPLSRDLRVENVIGICMSNVHPTNGTRTSGKYDANFYN
jgi:hypothetical protein